MVSRNLRFRFTLVSYNILSQTLLNDHSYLYNSCHPRDLEWPRRGHKIVRELMHDQADIICLQEVESDHLQSLYRPRLARYGYECLYKKKTGYKIDGCAIFYKSKLFRLLNHKGVEFNRTDVAHLLNRDNVGIIAVLKPRIMTQSESPHLVIANTHLIFNPRRSDIKLAQLKFFLSELEAISRETCDSTSESANSSSSAPSASASHGPSYHPTILCGDLNSTPDSEVNRYVLRNAQSRPQDDSELEEASLHTISSHLSEGRRNEFTNGNDKHESSSSPSDQSSGSQCQSNKDTTAARHTHDHHLQRQLAMKEHSHHCHHYHQSSSTESSESEGQLNNMQQLLDFNHSLKFKSVYPTRNKEGQRYVSTFSSDVVDYIFYTPKLRPESFKELLTEEQLEHIGPLPNSQFPSDHIPLGAKFTLK